MSAWQIPLRLAAARCLIGAASLVTAVPARVASAD
jgi:hypothetical protein